MAPKYKLTYFNLTGRAEPIRYIFAYAGQEYEDNRVNKEAWLELKPKTPFGKLPIIEIDGQQVGQSGAIARYLAKQFGLAGKDDWESLQVDSIVDALGDLSSAAMSLFREQNPEKIAEIKQSQAVILETFNKTLASNPSGFFVGSQVTWADLAVAASLSERIKRDPEALKPYPALSAHVEKINNLPNIKAWLEKRPKGDHPPMRPPKKD